MVLETFIMLVAPLLATGAVAQTDLVANGDFESGDTGFSSDYECCSCNWRHYLVLADADSCNWPGGDHTSGSGLFMVVNGDAGLTAWSQTVPTSQNTTYRLTTYVRSLYHEMPSDLEFTINGSSLGTLQLTTDTDVWAEFSADWNSGYATQATLAIFDLLPGAGGGNDFALDDISFEEVSSFSVDQATIRINGSDRPSIVSALKPFARSGSFDGTGDGLLTYHWEWAPGGSDAWQVSATDSHLNMIGGFASFGPESVQVIGPGVWDYRVVVTEPNAVASNTLRMIGSEPRTFSADAAANLTYLNSLAGQSADRGVLSGQFGGYASGLDGSGFDSSFADLITALDDSLGVWIALIGTDYGYSGPQEIHDTNIALANYLENGGLATVSWHASNPWQFGPLDLGVDSVKTDSTGNALVLGLFPQFVDSLLWAADAIGSRTPTPVAVAHWYELLDTIADSLATLGALAKPNDTVLWRPFHESNGNWFWWGGQDPDSFRSLWRHMHWYFADEKGLDNLLWVYSVNDTPVGVDRYPGDDYVDIVGIDKYGPDSLDVLESYVPLLQHGKPLGLAEYGRDPPDSVRSRGLARMTPDTVADRPRQAVLAGGWDYHMEIISRIKDNDYDQIVFFQTWHAPYAMVANNEINALLHDPLVVNRDELPGLTLDANLENSSPVVITIHPGAPNPFGRSTAIRFDLVRSAAVDLAVYDIRGRLVRTLLPKTQFGSGSHRIVWMGEGRHGRQVPSGIYFVRLEAAGEVRTQKVVRISD